MATQLTGNAKNITKGNHELEKSVPPQTLTLGEKTRPPSVLCLWPLTPERSIRVHKNLQSQIKSKASLSLGKLHDCSVPGSSLCRVVDVLLL